MFKSDFPFSPAKVPFYYGYIIIPAAVIGVFMSIPGQTAGFSAFTDPLIRDLDISRSLLAFSYFVGTACSGMLLPTAGVLLDTLGTRKVIFIVSLLFGLVLTLFSYCQFIFAFLENHIQFIDRKYIYIVGLSLLILGIRFFGQGMLPVISNTMISRWFDQKRGQVVAVMGVVNSLCFNAAPSVLSQMIEAYTWQSTWIIIAMISGGGFLIFSWLFFRDNPEECGLDVDGISRAPTKNEPNRTMTGVSVDEAKASLNFKVITLTLSLYGMTMTGITFNLEAIGTTAGLTKEQAMAIFIPVSFITIPIGFTTAYFSDKFPKKYLVVTLCLAQAVAYLCCTFLNTFTGYIGTIIFLGFSGGMFGPIMAIAYPWYFGRKHLGAINGKANSQIVIFSAIGPLVFAFLKELTASFNTALYVCAVFPLVLSLFSFKMTTVKMYKQ